MDEKKFREVEARLTKENPDMPLSKLRALIWKTYFEEMGIDRETLIKK